MADPSNEDPGGGAHDFEEDTPEIKDSTELGGGIWIILFGLVIVISLAANLILSILVARNRRKHNFVYFMHLFLFAINLIDFSLLAFEFSLGMGHEYPYSQFTCTLYQSVVKGNPIIQASAIVVLIFYTAKTYLTPQNLLPPQQTSELICSRNEQNNVRTFTFVHQNKMTSNVLGEQERQNSHSHGSTAGHYNQRANDFGKFACVVVFLVVIELILSVPTVLFASIVNVEDKRYCEIDLTSSPFLRKSLEDASTNASVVTEKLHQLILCLYYLIYSSILTFWLPLLISIFPAISLIRDKHRDKFPEVSVVLGTVSSFFIFYIFHATLVFGRHFYDLSGNEISTYNLWMIKVGQSLLLLIAYFWNFVRPALALSLDSDLKFDLMKMLCLTGYGSFSGGQMDNLPTLSNGTIQHQGSFVTYTQDIERSGRWEIVSGVKHVFTKTLLGNKNSNDGEDRNTFLIVPLVEIDEQMKMPFISNLENKTGMEFNVNDDVSSALTQTSENIGENKC